MISARWGVSEGGLDSTGWIRSLVRMSGDLEAGHGPSSFTAVEAGPVPSSFTAVEKLAVTTEAAVGVAGPNATAVASPYRCLMHSDICFKSDSTINSVSNVDTLIIYVLKAPQTSSGRWA
jgi:hypothetical protein